jgi:hypothetical protein
VLTVQLQEQVKLLPLILQISRGVFYVLDQPIQLSVLAVDVRALVDAGQKARLPVL